MNLHSLALIGIWTSEISAFAQLVNECAFFDVEDERYQKMNMLLLRIQYNAKKIDDLLLPFSETQ
jgi:hypothetical protein